MNVLASVISRQDINPRDFIPYAPQAGDSFWEQFQHYVNLINSCPAFISAALTVLVGLILFRILINLL